MDEEVHLKILFRNAHTLALKGRPLSDFKTTCDTDEAKGLPIKAHYRNDKRCKEIVHSISEVEREKIATSVAKVKFLSIMSDGATDSGHAEAEICYIRFCHLGDVSINFIGIKNIRKADADGITAALFAMLGSLCDQHEVEWQEKMVALGSDAAVMLGKTGGVIAKLRQRLNRPSLIAVYCSAHRFV